MARRFFQAMHGTTPECYSQESVRAAEAAEQAYARAHESVLSGANRQRSDIRPTHRKLVRSASVSVVDSLFTRTETSQHHDRGQRPMPEAEVLSLLTARGHIYSGYLWKKGDFTGFQRRFFILEGAYVKYHKEDPAMILVAPRV